MSQLLLLRHARAAWPMPGMADFDRALDETGRREAAEIGRRMRDAGLSPQVVLCSTARRARETWDLAAAALGAEADAARFVQALYDTDAAGYVDHARSAGDAASVLLVGHNPMIEDVAFALPSGPERDKVAGGFPTAGLAVIAFDGPLSRIAPGRGRLEVFLTP